MAAARIVCSSEVCTAALYAAPERLGSRVLSIRIPDGWLIRDGGKSLCPAHSGIGAPNTNELTLTTPDINGCQPNPGGRRHIWRADVADCVFYEPGVTVTVAVKWRCVLCDFMVDPAEPTDGHINEEGKR